MDDHPRSPRILFVETLKDPRLYPEQQVRHAYLTAYMLETALNQRRRLVLCEEPREHA